MAKNPMIKQYIKLNGREVYVGLCPDCHRQVFASKVSSSDSLVELDGTSHACEKG